MESDHAPHTIADKRLGLPEYLVSRAAAPDSTLANSGRDGGAAGRLCGSGWREVYGLAAFDALYTLAQGSCQVPSPEQIDSVLAETRAAYAWDPFCALTV